MDQQNAPLPTTPNTPQVPQQQESAPVTVSSSGGNTKKIIILAVILLLLAGGIGGGVYFMTQQKAAPVAVAPKNETAMKEPLSLTIDSPTDSTLVKDSMLVVKGKTLPNTTVALVTDSADETTDSDSSGNFESTIKLTSGINTLTVTAYDDDGEEKSTTMDVVYDEGK